MTSPPRRLLITIILFCSSTVFANNPVPSPSPVTPIFKRNFNGPFGDGTARKSMAACYESIALWQQIVEQATQPVPGAIVALYLGSPGNEENDVRPIAYAALVHAFTGTVNVNNSYFSPKERLEHRRKAIGLLHYLVQAHVTGAGACANGKKWGNQWQSAMWARSAGLAAWLMWDEIPPHLQAGLETMIAFEANRFVTAKPKSSLRNDTGAEENAWNAQILSLAACMFASRPEATEWHYAAKRWMYNSLSVAVDASNDDVGDDHQTIRRWVSTTNVHADFTIENHGIVHIGYLKTSASLLVENVTAYLLADLPVPKAALHHAGDCFNVLLRCMGQDAAAIYVSGNDWKLFHTQSSDAMLYTFMSLLAGDRRAAYLEPIALDYTLKIQKAEKGYYNMRRDLESGGLSASRLIAAYFAHAAISPGPEPAKNFETEMTGVSLFPEGKFAVHRTPAKFVSACLSQKRMLLALPENGSWVVWPHFASGTGYINGEDASGNTTLLASSFETNKDGFRITGVLKRADGKVEQSFAFISLPDDRVLYIERLRGPGIRTREGAVVGVEYDLGSNSRNVFHAEGKTGITGFESGKAQLRTWQSDWLNIDNRIGYVVKRFPVTTNLIRYHDEVAGSGRVPKLEEWVSLLGETNATKLTGDQWACVVTFLNHSASATRGAAQTVSLKIVDNTATCTLDDRNVTVQFDP